MFSIEKLKLRTLISLTIKLSKEKKKKCKVKLFGDFNGEVELQNFVFCFSPCFTPWLRLIFLHFFFTYGAVFNFWFDINNWRNARCNIQWENCGFHWQERCKLFDPLNIFVTPIILPTFSTNQYQFILLKQAMGVSEIFCILGWLAIVFSKVLSTFLF